MSVRARLAAVVALAVASVGCPELDPHTCREDADCNRRGLEGLCFEDACGYPDASCPSEYAYSPNAEVDTGPCVPQLCSSLSVTVDAAELDLEQTLLDYPLLISLPPGTSALGPPTSVTLDGVDLPFELAAGPSPAALHVTLPALAPDAALLVRIGFGQDSADPSPPGQVWAAGFLGVWHFDETLATTQEAQLANALGPNEFGTLAGGMDAQDSVPGIIGTAVAFDGVDDFASFRPSFLGGLQEFTLTMWVRIDGPDENASRVSYFEGLGGHTLYPRCWRSEDLRAQCQLRIEDAPGAITIGADGPRTGRFAHFALVLDPLTQTLQMFIDGELAADADASGVPLGGSESWDIARGEWGFSPITVDEVRVAERALSPSWLRADVRTQGDPGAAVRFSEVEDFCPFFQP